MIDAWGTHAGHFTGKKVSFKQENWTHVLRKVSILSDSFISRCFSWACRRSCVWFWVNHNGNVAWHYWLEGHTRQEEQVPGSCKPRTQTTGSSQWMKAESTPETRTEEVAEDRDRLWLSTLQCVPPYSVIWCQSYPSLSL